MQDLKWQEIYGWYWYSTQEIFHFTPADFDASARAYADRGITTVITFTSAHFIWSFRPWWDQIDRCLREIVRAFHAVGIKVVEHKSASLSFDPLTPDEWTYMENILRNRHSDIDSWPGLRDYVASDPVIDGVPLSQFRQIDGRTGQLTRSVYHGYVMCYNNPYYRREYLKYCEQVFTTGIDGMMNDDIQFFEQGCACEHCRKLFREETGYELPYPDKWAEFYDNYDDPAFIAWKRFKVASTTRLVEDIVQLEARHGLKLLRPNYIAHILGSNWTSANIETTTHLFNVYFQENCFSNLDKYSYPDYMLESIERFARAERHQIPSMSMFYPKVDDMLYFTWALAKTWGQLYTSSFEGVDTSAMERPYRAFERSHAAELTAPKKMADIAFFQSCRTRDLRPGGVKPFMSWLEASCFSGLVTDMVFEEDSLEKMGTYPLIAVIEASMLSDEDIVKLTAYARHGGRLLLVGLCGQYAGDARVRSPEEIAAAFGISARIIPSSYPSERYTGTFAYGPITVELPEVLSPYCFAAPAGDIVLTAQGQNLGVAQKIGQGELIWLLAAVNGNELQPALQSLRFLPDPPPCHTGPSLLPKLRRTSGAILNALVSGRVLETQTSQAELLAAAFTVDRGYVVHLVNLTDTLPTEPSIVRHEDPLPAFDGRYKLPESVHIRLHVDSPVTAAVLSTPERSDDLPLMVTMADGVAVCTVPAGTFGGYALIAFN